LKEVDIMEPIELLGHMVLYVLCIIYQVVVDIKNQDSVVERPTDWAQYYGQYLFYALYAFMLLIPIEILYWIALSILGK